MTLNLQTPFPTLVEVLVAGYAQLKLKKNMITWTSPKAKYLKCLLVVQQLCVMENLLYLARKEQCLALGTQLRTFKIVIIRFIEFSQVVKFNIYIRKMVYSLKKVRSDCCEQS
jgi:hypothetical protein